MREPATVFTHDLFSVATRAGSYGSLWRLRSFVRPYSRQMLVMLVCASLAVAASTLIPLVLEAVVNGPIAHGDRAALVPMFFLALGLGILEAGLIVARRAVQSMAVLKIEREIRDGLYARLQRLPIEFHDRWQTGQLLSRTTTDLGTIRRFLGFGAIFIVVDGLQYIAVMALLIATYAPLGVVVARDDAAGDLARKALRRRLLEDLASGSRPAGRPRDTDRGGRHGHARGEGVRAGRSHAGAFGASATTLRGPALDLVRLRAHFWGLLTLIPNITMAFVVLIGGIAVAHGHLSLGAIVAFTTLLVLLQYPIIDLGWILSMAQEAATAADRVCEIFDADITVRDRPVPLSRWCDRGVGWLRACRFLVPDEHLAGAARREPDDRARRDPRYRRVDRIGQEHAGVAPGSALRRHVRPHHPRRSGHPGHHARLPPPPGGRWPSKTPCCSR